MKNITAGVYKRDGAVSPPEPCMDWGEIRQLRQAKCRGCVHFNGSYANCLKSLLPVDCGTPTAISQSYE